MERKSFLRRAAEATSQDSTKTVETEYNYYIEEGAAYLERPHRDKDIGREFHPYERDKIDTLQPHGKLRSLIRSIIEAGK